MTEDLKPTRVNPIILGKDGSCMMENQELAKSQVKRLCKMIQYDLDKIDLNLTKKKSKNEKSNRDYRSRLG